MRQFVAILKDSFREAMDGFVIYAMLALSALVIVLLGSLSFAPEPPETAFNTILEQFRVVFPEKGMSRVFTGSSDQYKAADVQPAGDGYKLRVTVVARPNGGTITDAKGTRPILDQGDSFRQAVASWAKPANKAGEVNPDNPGQRGKGPGEKRVEFGHQSATADEQKAVTAAQMEEFIRNQFAVHAGMNATAKRVTDGAAEPTYAFDVTTTGGRAVRGWPHKVSLFFGAWTLPFPVTLGGTLFWIEDRLVNGIGAALALLIGVVITAFFIPNMIRKGSVDLLISKPIGRTQLLVYKYVGGLTFIFLLSAFTVGGVWLAIGLRSGYWDPKFLVVIPVLTFTFAILYAVSTAAAVITRSPIVAILLSVGFAVFLYIVGQVKTVFDTLKSDDQVKGELPDWAFTLVDALNNVLPRYKDLDKLTTKLLSEGTLTPAELRVRALDLIEYPSWAATFGVSTGFIALMLAVSCWWFSRRDY